MQDRLLERSHLAARLDAQLVHQRTAGGLVGGKRFGLPPRAIEREHVLPAQALVQRVLGHQRLELRHHVVLPEREIGLDPIAHR